MKLSIMLWSDVATYVHTGSCSYISTQGASTSVLVVVWHPYTFFLLSMQYCFTENGCQRVTEYLYCITNSKHSVHTRCTTKDKRQLYALTLRSRSMAFFFLSSESSLVGTFLRSCSILSVYEVQVGNPTMFLANIDTEEDNGLTTITLGIAVDGSGVTEPTPAALSFPASSC